MEILDRLEAIYDRVVTILGLLVAASIGFFAISMSVDWFYRFVLKIGTISWLRDVIEYLIYAGVFLGAPWVLRHRAHVRVDLILSSLSERGTYNLERFLNILGFVVCALLAWFGSNLVVELYEANSMDFKTITMPRWIPQVVFVLTMLLLMIEFAFRIIRPIPPGSADDVKDGF